MASKNKLSIYLIKDDFQTDPEIVERFDDFVAIPNVGTVYIKYSTVSSPDWAESFFNGEINTDNLFKANARAVLLSRITLDKRNAKDPDVIKTFAIVMGYGRSMLQEDVIEERFGLKVILNTIKPDSLRRISKINIGGNQKLSSEQLPLKSDISDFGLDINRDLVSNIAGISLDPTYVSGILAGGDILTLTADVDTSNVIDFLKKTYAKYTLSLYKTNFAWIDQIQEIRSSRLINQLNTSLIAEINQGSENVWMAAPEILDWEGIRGFKYVGIEIFDDIYIDKIRDSFRGALVNIDQLKSKRISVISQLDDSVSHTWSAGRCLFGELTLGGKAYCINNGKWYCINTDFVQKIKSEYADTQVATINFIDYDATHKNENEYSASFVNRYPTHYTLMDSDVITYGGGHSSIELCDILSSEKEMIHIKPYSSSSTLSHLFNQAAVSAELILSDASFVSLANEKIVRKTSNPNFLIKDRQDIKIIFGIISKSKTKLPKLPFFSEISFCYTKKRLLAFGFDVYIQNINNTK